MFNIRGLELVVLSVANIHAFHHPAVTSSGSTYYLNGGFSAYPFRQIIPVTDDTDMDEVMLQASTPA